MELVWRHWRGVAVLELHQKCCRVQIRDAKDSCGPAALQSPENTCGRGLKKHSLFCFSRAFRAQSGVSSPLPQ